jgi:tetratricopeptide (TPR) repeat protein
MKKKLLVLAIVFFFSGCSADLDIWKADRLAGLSRKSHQTALRLYKKALSVLPQGPKKDRVSLKLGALYLKNGDYAKAITSLKGLGSAEARRLLAVAFFKNSDFTGALEIFNKIGDQGDAEYLYDYGLVLEKSNLYDQALKLYTKIAKDPAYGAQASARIRAIDLLSAPAAFAGVEEFVKKIIEESPGKEAFREASAIYLLMDESVTLTEDNRLISEFHYATKVLNDRGKEKFGEVLLSYDSTYEKLELDYARTIKPDGTVVTVGDKNIRDVSLYLNYPLYSNARARIISMPEVTAGAVIEYKGRIIRSKLANIKDFDTAYWLAADEPILLERCTFIVPKSRVLKYKIVNAEYNTGNIDMIPKVKEDGERKVYSLEFKDVPQIIPEPAMPPSSRINPYILFSTFDAWKDIYAWWTQLYKDKAVCDEQIQSKVRELIKGKGTAEEKIRAIYNYCVQEIRYVAVEYGDAGYEPHKAAEIFSNKYGDCKDKAILLIAMLEAAGIEAYPVLISTSDSLDVQEDMPSILFDHAIAATKLNGKVVFMDATGATVSFADLPPGDQGRLALVFFKDKYELVKTPLFPPENNRTSTHMKIQVKSDESFTAERTVETQGAFQQAQRYWLKFTMPVLIEETLKNKARSIVEGAELGKYEVKNVNDLDKLVSLKFDFSGPRYFSKAGSSRIMKQLSDIDAALVVKESRRYPIEFGALDLHEEIIEVELPGHLAVKYLPSAVETKTKWLDFVSRYELIGAQGLRFTLSRKVKEKIIPAAEYESFKKTIEDLISRLNQQVILEEKKSP